MDQFFGRHTVLPKIVLLLHITINVVHISVGFNHFVTMCEAETVPIKTTVLSLMFSHKFMIMYMSNLKNEFKKWSRDLKIDI